MGKKSKWFSVVKKVFRFLFKDNVKIIFRDLDFVGDFLLIEVIFKYICILMGFEFL